MNDIYFFTAVCYERRPPSIKEFLLENVDSYFYLGGKKAQVITSENLDQKARQVVLIDSKASMLTTALKIVSYYTIIMPLVMLAAKAFLRSKYNFIIKKVSPLDNEKNHSTSNKTITDHSILLDQNSNNIGNNSSVKINEPAEQTKNIAATKIQSLFRGHFARSVLKNLKNQEALKFQEERRKAELEKEARQRDEEIRRFDEDLSALKKPQVEKLVEQRSRAALKIQSIWRGYSARVKVKKEKKSLLNYSLLEKAKHYIDTPSNLKNIPLASSGKTPVYLPKELPIVLKQSGSPANQKRFNQMKEGLDICEKSSYKNLVIPKARVYGNFIIESRLPITMHGTKEQIGLYIENRERFASAVKEFTGFFCQSHLSDITGGSNDPYETLSQTPVGRYDNVALYLEEEQGKIGLIDLEKFSPGCSQSGKKWCFYKCRTAVHLFPYHLDEIIDAAKKFDPTIEIYRKDLEQERDEALKRFKIAYEDHLDFVRQKNITLDNPIAFEKLSLARLEELKKVIERELLKENDKESFRECLGDKPNETLIGFNEKAFPKILDAVYKLISDGLKFNFQLNESPPSSNVQLLSVRTLNFESDYVIYDEFIDTTSKLIEMLSFKSPFRKKGFSNLILDIILKELEKGKEIAYYNPSFGDGGYVTKCVFC